MKPAVKLTCLAFLSVLLTACASTDTRHDITWEETNPQFNDQVFSNLLVIGLIDDRSSRIARESVFVGEMNRQGIPAKTSYDMISDFDTLRNQAEFRALLARNKFDGVLSVGILEQGAEYDYEGYRNQELALRALGSDAFFTRLSSDIAYYESGKFVMEIILYDEQTLEPVWSATTDSYSQEPEADMARSVADFVIGAMKQRGLLSST